MSFLIPQRIRAVWLKNRDEIRNAVGGSGPRFLSNWPVSKLDGEVPVFVFHSVEPEPFEAQLRYLAGNRYETVTGDELVEMCRRPPRAGHRTVALTFDDATGSFWTVAFPLLKKYGFRAILFPVAALVPNDSTHLPNLEDVWAGRISLAAIRDRERLQPLCSWHEIHEMWMSGVVDVQSHSLTHARVPISPRIVDFVRPGFDPYLFGNVNLPVSVEDDLDRPARNLILGAPVYEFAPRMAALPRHLEDPESRRRLVDHVRSSGGSTFFDRPGWRRELEALHMCASSQGISSRFEALGEVESRVRAEFAKSKAILEERLPRSSIRHFCYPWFTGSPTADRLAGECGYHSVLYGLGARAVNMEGGLPIRIRRVSEEYLYCLPGRGRRRPASVWRKKIARALRR